MFNFEPIVIRSSIVDSIYLDPKAFLSQLKIEMEERYLGSCDFYVLTNLIEMYIACLTNTQENINNGDEPIAVRFNSGTDNRDIKNPLDIEDFAARLAVAEKRSNIIIADTNTDAAGKANIIGLIPTFIVDLKRYLTKTLVSNNSLRTICILYSDRYRNRPGEFLIRASKVDSDDIEILIAVNTIRYTKEPENETYEVKEYNNAEKELKDDDEDEYGIYGVDF